MTISMLQGNDHYPTGLLNGHAKELVKSHYIWIFLSLQFWLLISDSVVCVYSALNLGHLNETIDNFTWVGGWVGGVHIPLPPSSPENSLSWSPLIPSTQITYMYQCEIIAYP